MLVNLVIKRSKCGTIELNDFLKHFGTFFEEFQQEGTSCWLFYVLFVLRRFSMVILILFVKEPILQVSLSFALSISVNITQIIIYLLTRRPFIEGISGLSILFNEIITSAFFVVLTMPYLPPAKMNTARVTSLCIELILVTLIANISLNLISTIKKLKNWITARRENLRNKVMPVMITDEKINTFNELQSLEKD